MRIYRMTKAAYAPTAFKGSRGRGRWHEQGMAMVYAADAPATALLETLVHADRAALLTADYVVFEIELEPERHLLRLSEDLWPQDWQAWPWPAATQRIGTFWYEEHRSVVLEVPSAVLPAQRNYLISPSHSAFDELTISPPRAFPIDPRLVVRTK